MRRWEWVALAAIAALAAGLFLWELSDVGYANTYYTAAAQAAGQSWHAFFFGALDAGSFITVDKPPMGVWPMGLSVRLFGLSAWSVLAPQALMGIAAVLVLFDVVRRSFGTLTGLLAALMFALTPVAVLMFRFNNPDALLTLLLIGAAWGLVRALESGQTRWLVLSAVLVGCGFNTKFLQAWIVLPGFALTYLLAGAPRLLVRIRQLTITAAAVIVSSGWWMFVVDLIPPDQRPYIGGGGTNLVRDLALGYDGLGRVFGQRVGPQNVLQVVGGSGAQQPPGPGGGPGSGGAPDLFRMFNDEFAGEASWLLPFALVSLLALLVATRRVARTDRVRGGLLVWGGWLLTHAVVFSLSRGIIHPYYAVALAPGSVALAAAGIVGLGSRAPSTGAARFAL
ncbi:MAG: glycosyltransferase family 39 protein, partial [Deltaproteobacteria bacterium]|nr:glycosyltransferase family 39 protein [Deltaproteobacteria bacterium]